MIAPRIRCAIYTRKSTDEGLEQAFNSLDAQREAGDLHNLIGLMLTPLVAPALDGKRPGWSTRAGITLSA